MSRNNNSVSSNFGGIIAEEKQINSAAAVGSGGSFGSYFQGVASYLPSSIKKQLHIPPSSHHHHFDDDHDIVLGAEFDKYETASGETHLCLMLSYNNGFQVWDLQHPDGKREIVSVREPTPIKSIRFLPNPIAKEPPNSLLSGKRPLLAVISSEESTKFPRSNVKFYSLKSNDYINILRFRSPVYTIECNQRMLFVGLRDNIYGFDLITMERVLNLPCYPSPLNNAVMALGPRWLAYAANQIIPPTPSISPHNAHLGPAANSKLVEVAKDVATDLAKEVAQGLFYLGDMGRKTVSNYLYPEDQAPGPNSSGGNNLQVAPLEYKDTEHAGTIIIYDTVAKKNILHFRAHSQALSVLRFDRSGTLLVTSSVDGHNFNVFQIGASGAGVGGQELTYRHLYKLVRGVTNATIQDISFSTDSKWMAISSTRGTTHIYAINPQGGPVNVLTHVPAANRPLDMLTPHKPDLPVPLVTLSVCNRIKTANTDEGSTRNNNAIGSTAKFVGISPVDERLLVFSKNGMLTLYQLYPRPPTQPELDPLSLQLVLSPLVEADMGRRTKWPEYRQSAKELSDKDKYGSGSSQESDLKWLSHVEISTHSPHLRLLWIGCPQFSFRTYQPTAALFVPPSSSPPSLLKGTTNELLSTSPPSPYHDLTSRGTTIPTTITTFSNYSPAANPTNSNNNTSSNSVGILFDENAMTSLPTKRVDIRRYDPLPFKESLEDLHNAASPPQMEDIIKENLLDAISTPMVAEKKPNVYDFPASKPTTDSELSGMQARRQDPPRSSPPYTSPIVAATMPTTNNNPPYFSRPTATSNVPSLLPTPSPPSAATVPPPIRSTIATSTSSLIPESVLASRSPSFATSSTMQSSVSGSPSYYSRYTPPATHSALSGSLHGPSYSSSYTTTASPSYTTPVSSMAPASPILPSAANTSPPRSNSYVSTNSPMPFTSTYTSSPTLTSSPPHTTSHNPTPRTTTTSSSPILPRTSSPQVSTPQVRDNAASPSTPPRSSPSPISPSLARTTSPTRTTSPQAIPSSITTKAAHSPFSASPPFPESELSQNPPKKISNTNNNSSNNSNNTYNDNNSSHNNKQKTEEDEDEFSLVSRGTSK